MLVLRGLGWIGLLISLWGMGWWHGALPQIALTLAPGQGARPVRAPTLLTPVTLRPEAGSVQATTHGPFAAGARLTWTVHTPFGSSLGLEAIALGDAAQFDRFGILAAHGGGQTSAVFLGHAVSSLQLTAIGGRFDGMGMVEVRLAAPAPGLAD